MSYVDRILQPGETINYRGKLHWFIFLPSIGVMILALAIYVAGAIWLSPGESWLKTIVNWTALIVFVLAIVMALKAWLTAVTTEIAVTNRRVIYKRGFISRKTIEMNMDKVESVDVDQSVLGRIFDYGDVIIRGVGEGLEPFRNVDSPLEFRNHVTHH